MRAYGWRRSSLESRLGHSLRRGVKTPALWDVLRKINVQYPAFLSCFWLLASSIRRSDIGFHCAVRVRVRATESGGRRGASVAKQIRTG